MLVTQNLHTFSIQLFMYHMLAPKLVFHLCNLGLKSVLHPRDLGLTSVFIHFILDPKSVFQPEGGFVTTGGSPYKISFQNGNSRQLRTLFHTCCVVGMSVVHAGALTIPLETGVPGWETVFAKLPTTEHPARESDRDGKPCSANCFREISGSSNLFVQNIEQEMIVRFTVCAISET